MNQLPAELILMILDHLGIDDILNCKLINKKFKTIIINYLRIKESLVLSDNNYLPLIKDGFI